MLIPNKTLLAEAFRAFRDLAKIRFKFGGITIHLPPIGGKNENGDSHWQIPSMQNGQVTTEQRICRSKTRVCTCYTTTAYPYPIFVHVISMLMKISVASGANQSLNYVSKLYCWIYLVYPTIFKQQKEWWWPSGRKFRLMPMFILV